MPAAALAVDDRLAPFRRFVRELTALIDMGPDEPRVLADGKALLEDLIADSRWLPDSHAEPDPQRYRQYLLYRDPLSRFSVVSFVWGPGQSTPVHDHRTWGLVGVLRGAEIAESFALEDGALVPLGRERLETGEVDAVSPAIGDLHRVSNAHADAVSISIHVYGADIGTVRRAVYEPDGREKPFISGYADVPALI